jgi:F0F1-type ATP synthase assembly protein I
MPLDSKPDSNAPKIPSVQKVKKVSNQAALAMELPFTLVGALGVAVAAGYFLDRWLHTKPIFTLIFGVLGFFAGVREVARRLPGSGDGESRS